MGITTDKTDITRTSTSIHLEMDGRTAKVLDVQEFFDTVIGGYNDGTDGNLEATPELARSIIPSGTGYYRDFSYIAPELPQFIHANCVGCMTCVTECPDTAILGKVVEETTLERYCAELSDPDESAFMQDQFCRTNKFYKAPAKKGEAPGMFGIFVDPTKCKGCAECVEVCADLGYRALTMIKKEDNTVPLFQRGMNFFRKLPPTPARYIHEKVPVDMMLAEQSLATFVGGAGSCAGCGEATVVRMWLAALGYKYGSENIGLVASTGCNTVYGSTYPFNPFTMPWTNSLFENSPADAIGIRMRWNQLGWREKQLWCIGGDGAMNDIGFQSLSRMLTSGLNISVLILDTQVYSNTGGQSSTSTYTGQETKMSQHGSVIPGKRERRKEIGQICMMHPNTFVAQTVQAIPNHFYKSILEAASFDGPSVVNVYTTCQPEHGVGDEAARRQAKHAVESRAFPVYIYDPRKGESMKERLSLQGNPGQKQDWYTVPKTGEVVDFVSFARSEGRFAKHFDERGNPSEALLASQEERLANWRFLREMAGLR